MKFRTYLIEAAYKGNLGFVELMDFYDKANSKEIKEMEKILKSKDWEAFKKLINEVLNIKLI